MNSQRELYFTTCILLTLITGCGGGGSSTSNTSPALTHQQNMIELRDRYIQFAQTLYDGNDVASWGEGSANIDLRGDGDQDVLVTTAASGTQETAFHAFENTSSGFELIYTGVEAAAATYTVFDANGDGLEDIYLGHGDDTEEAIEAGAVGAQDYLLFQVGDGTFVDVSDTHLPSAYSDDNPETGFFTHGSCSGNIDDDGDIDVVILNQDEERLLVNNGDGVFTDATPRLDQDTLETTKEEDWVFGFTWCEIGDLNADGFTDVILGSNNEDSAVTGAGEVIGASHLVLFNDGSNNYKYTEHSAVSTGVGEIITLDVEILDYNLDGCPDFAVQAVERDYEQSRVVVYGGQCNGPFQIAFVSELSEYALFELEVLYINDDEFPDIVTYHARGTPPPQLNEVTSVRLKNRTKTAGYHLRPVRMRSRSL